MEDSRVLNKDKEILEHLISVYPEEGCGILINKRGKIVWMSCENTAIKPEEDFVISAKDYIRASLLGDIHAIVHSHPGVSCEPSESDIKTSDFLGIPYIIYSLPSMEKYEYTPKNIRNKLLGRDYEFGQSDCYSLVRDYYKQELDLTLPTILFEDAWWDKGLNYFDDLFQNFGFVEVEKPQEHDGIIFSVFCNVPNHCGVYLGEDLFLHHAVNRLSCRESIHSGWGQHIVRYVRCKQFI